MTPGENLDAIAKRFAALEAAWKNQSGTKQLNAGFASVRAAIDRALADRAAWLRGPFSPPPRDAVETRAVHMAPELRRAQSEPEAALSPLMSCPRCLRPDAERADVEARGVCLDCSLAGHATKSPAPAGAVTSLAEPPPPGSQDVVDGAGSAVRTEGSATL